MPEPSRVDPGVVDGGSAGPERKPGVLKGKMWIADDFDETPQDLIDSFYESESDGYLFGDHLDSHARD